MTATEVPTDMPNRVRSCAFPEAGEQHHDADHSSIQQQHHRRIDSIIKIGALHGGIAVTDAPVIPALHVIFQTQRPDGADVVQSLGHLPGDCGDRAAVVQLRGQHPFLDMTGKHGKQRQHQQQNQCKAGCFLPQSTPMMETMRQASAAMLMI